MPACARSLPARAFGGRHSLRRSRTTIARAPSNRARRDDRRTTHSEGHVVVVKLLRSLVVCVRLTRTRGRQEKRKQNRFSLRRCTKSRNARPTDRRWNRANSRVGRILVKRASASCVLRLFDKCVKPLRPFARRQSARAPGGLHDPRPRSPWTPPSSWPSWGDARVAPDRRRGSGRGARTRRRNLSVPKGISLDRSDPTIARVPVSRPRERDGWPARRAERVGAAVRGRRASHPGRARGRGCDARVERRGDGARGGRLRRHRGEARVRGRVRRGAGDA